MDIFAALADPKRRHIIDTLHQQGPLSIKQLTSGIAISRQGMTKHLDILIKSKVINAEFVGKERMHRLNPKVVQNLLDWLTPFAQEWDVKLNRLSEHIGEKNDK